MTASCNATTILPKHRSCPRSMPGNKNISKYSRLSSLTNADVLQSCPAYHPRRPAGTAGRAVPSDAHGRGLRLHAAKGLRGFWQSIGGVVPESSVPAPASAPLDGMPGAFPVPEGSSSVRASSLAPGAPPSRSREPESAGTRFAVDQTKPTTSVQVRLAYGTRSVQGTLFLLAFR
jgi:hypothetical protein